MEFTQGQEYKRSQIHEQFGGSRQSGISTPAKHPFVFLFTGQSGKLYGYDDGWKGDEYHYYGQGQAGDMEFKRGNKAIRDAKRNGEEILLFETTNKGIVEFVGQMRCLGWFTATGRDRSGLLRECIVFRLAPSS